MKHKKKCGLKLARNIEGEPVEIANKKEKKHKGLSLGLNAGGEPVELESFKEWLKNQPDFLSLTKL